MRLPRLGVRYASADNCSSRAASPADMDAGFSDGMRMVKA
jgi:hypothetical protein